MSRRRKKKQEQKQAPKENPRYDAQAVGIVLDSLAKTYASEIHALRAHCILRAYPLALLNTITVLDLILQTGHVPSAWKALAVLERVNKTLDTRTHPHLADLRELATVADEARAWRRT